MSECFQEGVQQLIACSPLPMAAMEGKDHIVQCVNSAFCRLIGKQEEEMNGVAFAHAVLHGETLVPLFDGVYQTAEPQLRAALEIDTPDGDGKGDFWPCAVWPIPGADKQPVGVVFQVLYPETLLVQHRRGAMYEELMRGVVRQHERAEAADATNIELTDVLQTVRKARGRAEKSSQAKGIFLTSMSHELRTPLNVIIGYSELLQDVAREKQYIEIEADLATIRGAGMNLLELINGLLNMSKIEAGKMEPVSRRFRTGNLLRLVCEQVKPLADKNGNVFTTGFAKGLGIMHSDEGKIRQILLNLLSNAAKFTKQGTITLEAKREHDAAGGEVMIFRVKDTGIGIGSKFTENVFVPFYQIAKRPGSTVEQGTGLGLSLARQYCELLGGSIELKSTPGKGSCFTVRLPVQLAKR